MKRESRNRPFARMRVVVWGVAGLVGGGPGWAESASEIVFQDPPAMVLAKAEEGGGAGEAAPAARRALEAAQARASDLEKKLEQEIQRREKAGKELVAAWKQSVAAREEAEQLRRQLAESGKASARVREVEKQLAGKVSELATAGEKSAALEKERDRLSRQQQQAQREWEAERAAWKGQKDGWEKEKAALAAQVRDGEKAREGEKARAAAELESQKEAQARQAREQEEGFQKKARALGEGLAEKEAALAKSGEQIGLLKAELAAAKTRLQGKAEGEAARAAAEERAKGLEKEKAALAAQVRDGEKAREGEKARAAAELESQKAAQVRQAREREEGFQKEMKTLREGLAEKEAALARLGDQVRQLQAHVAALTAQGKADAEASASAQRKQAEEIDGLRRQAADRTTLKSDNEGLAARLEAKDQQRGELEGQLQKLKRQHQDQSVELGQVRARLEEVAREAEEQKEKWRSEQALLREQMRDEGLVRQGKALREQLGPADNTALVGSLNDAGLVMLAEGRLDEAEGLFRRALEILGRTEERANPSAGTLQQHLADVAWMRNDLGAAASFYEQSAQQFSAALGASHPRHAAALNGLARVRRAQGRPEEAEELYRMAIHIYERKAAGNPGDLVVPLHNLAQLLMEQGRQEEAGALLDRAVDLMEKDKNADAGRSMIVMRTVIRHCQAVGDAEKAARCEEKINQLAMDALVK